MILADICQEIDHSETILGLQDNDILSGSGGDDIVKGNDGDDKILGYAGDDVLQGDSGDDKIDSGWRNDVLIGGNGDDILSGEDGDDILYGVTGNDIVRGGHGANEFICGDGIDTILDYDPAQGDIKSNDCEIFGGIWRPMHSDCYDFLTNINILDIVMSQSALKRFGVFL
jgi:hypothetical protein